VKQKDK